MAIFYQCDWDDQHLVSSVFHSLKGSPGDIARSLGKDATFNDVLQTLDVHYGVVMTFDAFSKELYSLKQGSGENIGDFGTHLSQQVLQMEYPGWIQPEHMEKLKHDHFYEGLNPEYWWMLAHKVHGEWHAGYSDLLLAAWKLERWVETRGPLPQKTPADSGLNIRCSQTPGNSFPSHKLKGNCTFTVQAVTIWNDEVEEDSSAKQEGEGRDGAFDWWRCQSVRQSRKNRSVYGVYHLLCQGSQAIPKEEQKLFQVWESQPPHVGLPERY